MNPYTDTTVTRLAGGKVRVDTPSGHAIYDCTRLDSFGRYPLTLGSGTADRRAAVVAFVRSLGCDAFVGFTSDDESFGTEPVAITCGDPAVILLDGGSETHPACQAHR